MIWKGQSLRLQILRELIMLLNILIGYLADILDQRAKCGPDSRGKEFVISFMENTSNDNRANMKFVDLYISTASVTDVTVNVSAPRFSANKLDQTFHVISGKVHHLQLDYSFLNFGSNKGSKGIHITATEEIIVFSINKQDSATDGFLAFPIDVLGLTHYAVCFSYATTTKYKSDIVVVGTKDHTDLSIQLSTNKRVEVHFEGKTYRYNQWINLTLDAFDTLQLETLGDLTGSLITADKPIVVLSGNMKTSLHVDGGTNGKDHLVEQIPPTTTWGKHFVTFPFPGRSDGYVLRFVASEDHTNISVSGCIAKTFELNTRSFRQESIPKSSCFLIINSSKPILIAQFAKSGDGIILSDPAMFVIPPVEQYASNYVLSSPPATHGNFQNYFLIVIKDSEKDGLIIDGLDIHSANYNLRPIPGTNLVGGHVYLGNDTASHTIRHRSPNSVFGAIAYGGAKWESYALLAGLRLAPMNTVCTPSQMVVADGIDNDCDRYIDEEICNGKDEDGDSLIDEDCAASDPFYTSSTIVPPPTTSSPMTASPSTTKPSSTVQSSPITASPSTKAPFSTTASNYLKGKPLHDDNTHNRKESKTIWVIPNWLQTLEVVVLISIFCVILGASLCCCKKLSGLVCRRNKDEDEEKFKLSVWKKKKRPLPSQRKQ